MRELKRKTNVGLVLISHDLNAMESIADRVIVMYLGTHRRDGPPRSSAIRQHDYTRLLLAARLVADPQQARAQRLASASQREVI